MVDLSQDINRDSVFSFTRGLSCENMIQPKTSSLLFYLKNLSRKLSPKFTVLHPTLQIGNEIKKLAIDDDQRKREIEMLCCDSIAIERNHLFNSLMAKRKYNMADAASYSTHVASRLLQNLRNQSSFLQRIVPF